MFCERVETTNVPGATTSGLKRPKSPSVPMPTLPRLENDATSLSLSVKPTNNWLVSPLITASLVMLRELSIAPTVITFLAVAGARMLSGSPTVPLVLPKPLFPAANTYRIGCEPGLSAIASRTAAS